MQLLALNEYGVANRGRHAENVETRGEDRYPLSTQRDTRVPFTATNTKNNRVLAFKGAAQMIPYPVLPGPADKGFECKIYPRVQPAAE